MLSEHSFISDLDTLRFGFKVAKINDFSECPEKIITHLKNNGVKLVLSKINAEEYSTINMLESNGFQIKDIQITYKYDLSCYDINNTYDNLNVIIRDAVREDIVELQNIAVLSFDKYGHYSSDKKLEQFNCKEIYSDWIKRSIEDDNVADKIIVAEVDGKAVGFLSFKIYDNKYAAGGLGAVHPDYRNNDIFRIITIHGLNWGKEINLEWEEHNVLITNYPVNRSFIKLGFKPYKSFITMHYWI